MTIFRIPFLWERIQPTLGGALDATYLGLITTLVDYITARKNVYGTNMRCILDMHNYSERRVSGTLHEIGSAEVPAADYNDAWERIANEFEDNANVELEMMNEPRQWNAAETVTFLNDAVTAIRGQDAGNVVHFDFAGNSNFASLFANTSSPAFELDNYADSLGNFLIHGHGYFDDNKTGGRFAGDDGGLVRRRISRSLLPPFTQTCRQLGLRACIGEINVGDQANFTDLAREELASVAEHVASNSDVYDQFILWSAGQNWAADYFYLASPASEQFTIVESRLRAHNTQVLAA